MKVKAALLSLTLAGGAFALDEYMPLAPGVLELDGGVSYVSPEVGDATVGIPLQVKYGLMEGLDVELAAEYSTADGASGLGQPQLALKYALPGDMGLGVFANVVLPFATGDLSDGYKGLGIAPGVVYGRNFDKIQAVALAYYQINMKDSDDFERDDALRVFLKPGYMVNDALAGYVGIDYNKAGDANSTKLVPGITYTVTPELAVEANVPVVIAESNSGKYWGVWASLYYTLGL